MIYNNEPLNWLDLQDRVKDILEVIGYHAEVGKTIESARGKVEIDVYAEDIRYKPLLTIICECKDWNSNVPQTTIHSLQTNISNIGAHLGIIISKKGFQSGAFEAAKYSNIKLLNWEEFQKLYEYDWIEAQVSRLDKLDSDLFEYMDHYTGFVLNHLKKNKLDEYEKLCKKFSFTNYASKLTLARYYNKSVDYKKIIGDFPIKLEVPSDQVNKKIIEILSYKELFDKLFEFSKLGLEEFDKFFYPFKLKKH